MGEVNAICGNSIGQETMVPPHFDLISTAKSPSYLTKDQGMPTSNALKECPHVPFYILLDLILGDEKYTVKII